MAEAQIDVKERKVSFIDMGVSTLRSKRPCTLGCKAYFELEILDQHIESPQYGFVTAEFERVLGVSDNGVGDDSASWAVDGYRKLKFRDGDEAYSCVWK